MMKQISWSALVAVVVVSLAQAAFANGDAAEKPKDKKDEKVVTTDSGTGEMNVIAGGVVSMVKLAVTGSLLFPTSSVATAEIV